MSKESNSTANEGKRQFNRSIIYNLDSSRGSDSHRLSVPLKSDALTIEPPKLQEKLTQTQQYKPILTA